MPKYVIRSEWRIRRPDGTEYDEDEAVAEFRAQADASQLPDEHWQLIDAETGEVIEERE